ncbi:MAG TPA: hypothetical protein PK926_05760 [Spirochaetota bacterium]|nr:hypothetical protein [Spirochaetota bacterium]HPI87730.1 hypothetical protein [Spirochaetota bacterium]HPR48145.1 hypothetical protein [Spirochaetota bacterium]
MKHISRNELSIDEIKNKQIVLDKKIRQLKVQGNNNEDVAHFCNDSSEE